MHQNHNSEAEAIAERLAQLRSELATLNAQEVRIIAVTKTHPPQMVSACLAAGLCNIGENRQNEARDKFALVTPPENADAPIYHHIGPLQSGAARQIPGLFHYVHGASSLSAIETLVQASERHLEREFAAGNDPTTDPERFPLRYLIQIRLTDESTKLGGLDYDQFRSLRDQLPKSDAARFVGFMGIGPESGDPIETEESFLRLRQIRDLELPGGELSIGMSGDWPIAVRAGATMIRVGSLLLGSRKGGPWRPEE